MRTQPFPTMTKTRSRVGAVLVGVLGLTALACIDLTTPTTHPLLGNAYDPVNNCLNPQQGFDIVDGPQPSLACPLACVTDAKTGTLYLTTECPPYPTADTIETGDAGTDPCGVAMMAWNAMAACGAAPVDAGGDAGADAAVDAMAADVSVEGSASADGSPDAQE
jgi:hypothetical protein